MLQCKNYADGNVLSLSANMQIAARRGNCENASNEL